mmetsp:Transcript_19381/g.48267  ORF Transcript_19381/g.48267 Transcript_19381/m.48267 type:complete len:211 (-) Transcript_19381:1036-1668(-)
MRVAFLVVVIIAFVLFSSRRLRECRAVVHGKGNGFVVVKVASGIFVPGNTRHGHHVQSPPRIFQHSRHILFGHASTTRRQTRSFKGLFVVNRRKRKGGTLFRGIPFGKGLGGGGVPKVFRCGVGAGKDGRRGLWFFRKLERVRLCFAKGEKVLVVVMVVWQWICFVNFILFRFHRFLHLAVGFQLFPGLFVHVLRVWHCLRRKRNLIFGV